MECSLTNALVVKWPQNPHSHVPKSKLFQWYGGCYNSKGETNSILMQWL